MASCPLCRQRKGRRSCPAKGEIICSHCCGTKRRVEIDCPGDCVYLTGSHATAWEGRETERKRDARRLAAHAQDLTESQVRLLFLSLAGLGAMRARRQGLDDALLLQAVTALRKTAETRERGILYDHQVEDLRAQGLATELRALFEARDEAGDAPPPDDRDLLPVLRVLEAAVAGCLREAAGATTFLDTAARVAGRLGAAPPAGPRPLILEP